MYGIRQVNIRTSLPLAILDYLLLINLFILVTEIRLLVNQKCITGKMNNLHWIKSERCCFPLPLAIKSGMKDITVRRLLSHQDWIPSQAYLVPTFSGHQLGCQDNRLLTSWHTDSYHHILKLSYRFTVVKRMTCAWLPRFCKEKYRQMSIKFYINHKT